VACWLCHIKVGFVDSFETRNIYMSVENYSGLVSLQTIPRMWAQSSWRQKENALSCLFSRPSTDWQETKVHNTLRQRGPYIWKEQRNRKCYPWHVPPTKQVLDFPLWMFSKALKCIAKFKVGLPHSSTVFFQKIGYSIAFCCAPTRKSIDCVQIFQIWPHKQLILSPLAPDIWKQLKKFVTQIWLILKSMEWLQYPTTGVNLGRLSPSCERQVLTATK